MRHLLAALAALCAFAGPAFAADLVASPATLGAVIKAAAPCGDKILLAGGAWPNAYPPARAFTCPTVMTSADPANPAVFTAAGRQALRLVAGWSNLVLTGVVVDVSATTADYGVGLQIDGGANIAVDQVRFVGQRRDTTAWGVGISATRVARLTVTRSPFTDLSRGAVISHTSDLVFAFNDIAGMGTDGLNIGGIHRGLVEGNWFHDFRWVAPAHPDEIQLMNIGLAPDGTATYTSDLVIRGNLMQSPPTGGVQGGLFGTENGQPILNLVAEDNLKINGAWLGFRMDGPGTVTLARNTILFQQQRDATGKLIDPSYSSILFQKATGTATGNTAPLVSLNTGIVQSGTTLKPNATQAEVDAAVAAWMATWRPKAVPEPEPAPVDPRDAEIAELTAQVDQLQAQLAAAQTSLATAQADLAAAKAASAALGDQLAIEQASYAKASADLDAVRAALASAQAAAGVIAAKAGEISALNP